MWLTDGDAAVGAAQVDVALGDGRHAELVVGSGEEGGKGAGKHHVSVSNGTTDRHAHLQDRDERRSRKPALVKIQFRLAAQAVLYNVSVLPTMFCSAM